MKNLKNNFALFALIIGILLTFSHTAQAQPEPDGFAPNVNDTVRAIAVQPDGKVIIGGDFTQVEGVTRNRIARLNADGTLDTGFDPNVSGTVNSIVFQSDGRILVGGNFNQVSGQQRNNIFRLNTDGTLDMNFDPPVLGAVFTIAVQTDGKILVGGFFNRFGFVPDDNVGSIIRLNTDGTLDTPFNPNANAPVRSIVLQADGKILVGGDFTSISGQTRNRLARLNTDGTADSFNPSADNNVRQLALQTDGKILVVGNFTTINTVTRTSIARLNADGTLDTGFVANADSDVNTVALQSDGKILVGGSFVMINGQNRRLIARLNTDGTADLFNPSPDSTVQTIFVQTDGRFLVGGSFTVINGLSRNRIARFALAPTAANLTVDRTDDATVSNCLSGTPNDCTLRGAIAAANAASADDVIGFDPTVFSTPQTITLTSSAGSLTIANNGTLTINGTGANQLTVSGNNNKRIFTISSGANAAINALTVTGGNSLGGANGGRGGGILNNGGTTTLNNAIVSGNSALGQGGGIFSADNSATTLNNSTVSGNTAPDDGGISNNGGTTTLNNSTVSGNSATNNTGGGIGNNSGTTTLNNSTVSGNSAASFRGGGINNSGTLKLNSSTVSGNMAPNGGGISNNGGTTTLNNSIIANSTSGGDCSGTVNASYSLVEDGTCGVMNGVNNNLTGDPNLGPLQNNGGSTQTHALLTGSIAIDKGNSTLTTDQRGFTRPVDDPNTPNAAGGNGSDIGSFEALAPTAASVSISGRVSNGKRGVSRAVVHITDQNGNIRTARTNMFGYYRFDDVEVGQTLIVNVFHKRYQFNTQVVSPNETLTNLNFTAQDNRTLLRR